MSGGCLETRPVETRGALNEESADPWTSAVRWEDPDGRFAIDFPGEPELTEEEEQFPGGSLTRHDLYLEVGDEYYFSLSWSDAPPGTPLQETREIRPDAPEQAARRDDGVVVERREVGFVGLPALEFQVQAEGGPSTYWDRQVVVGGRLYEFTTGQLDSSREAFDRFVGSFELLEPPMEEGAEFFEVADRRCAKDLDAGPSVPGDSLEERSTVILGHAERVQALAGTLAQTPASPHEQGPAAAFIDALRRLHDSATKLADALRDNAPDARTLARATNAETDFLAALAKEMQAPACQVLDGRPDGRPQA